MDRKTAVQQRIHADYLVAADGANSLALRTLAIPTKSFTLSKMHTLAIDFRADLSELVRGHEFILCTIETPEAPGLLMAINNHVLHEVPLRWPHDTSHGDALLARSLCQQGGEGFVKPVPPPRSTPRLPC